LSDWQYYIGLVKLEPWSIGWVYTKASSLYNHKIKANRPGVKCPEIKRNSRLAKKLKKEKSCKPQAASLTVTEGYYRMKT